MTLSRREVLKAGGAVGLAFLVEGCSFFDTKSIDKTAEKLTEGGDEFGNKIVDNRRIFLDKIIESDEECVKKTEKYKKEFINDYLNSGTKELT